MKRAALFIVLMLPCAALAQDSASYSLREHTFNAGGSPAEGAVLTSASYRIKLSAVGQGLVPLKSSSPSYITKPEFVSAYPPPGEVLDLLFTDATTLVWIPEKSVGVYNLYEGSVTDPFDPAYGTCQPPSLAVETATITDTPPVGGILFFLVTAENLLAEEGTKGDDSTGTERPNPTPCP